MGLKLDIGVARFPYGGNGGTSSEVLEVGDWMRRVDRAVAKDKRIGRFLERRFSDTPITMTRNAAVKWAREHELDVLIMVDSDMFPDHNMIVNGDRTAKPFFESSFDFLYDHWAKGPVCIAAPYMGVEPNQHVENCYIFHWEAKHSSFDFHPDAETGPAFALQQYPRGLVSFLTGITPAAALPTGLIMYDMRCFDLVDITNKNEDGTLKKGKDAHGWFYYEWTDAFAAMKASTEDVTQTRDLSMAGCEQLGYNPVFCNWDAWAGHLKPVWLTKPQDIGSGYVAKHMKASLSRPPVGEGIMDVDFGAPPTKFDPALPDMAAPQPSQYEERSIEALHASPGTNPKPGETFELPPAFFEATLEEAGEAASE